MSETCKVKFGEFPVVRTSQDLFLAAGRLATSNYACVIEPDADLLSWAESIPPYDDDPDIPDEPMLRALNVALELSNPQQDWSSNVENDIPYSLFHVPNNPAHNRQDFGFHSDAGVDPWAIGINYHKTEALPGGVEITCATPTDQYSKTPEEHSLLSALLRQELTDPSLALPTSFRRVRLEHGGIVAFSTYGPNQRRQLHDFRSLSTERQSYVWFLDGIVRQEYRTDHESQAD